MGGYRENEEMEEDRAIEEMVREFKEFLNDFYKLHLVCDQKKFILKHLFNLIEKHIIAINSCQKFKNTVLMKLEEFQRNSFTSDEKKIIEGYKYFLLDCNE